MVEVEHLSVLFSDFQLGPIDLSIEKGEFFVIIGPTGAGKSMLLESVAGLCHIQSGKIIVGDRDITHLPPEKRGVGIVYQDYALFPHLDVLGNIAYGLKFNKKHFGNTDNHLRELINLLKIESLLDRYPGTLSGGEKQRIALARALVVEPSLLLLDEPLSAIDQISRVELRRELKKMNKETKTTFIMVTHDINEALILADRIGVMDGGRMVQVGKPEEIFKTPESPFVAKLTTKSVKQASTISGS